MRPCRVVGSIERAEAEQKDRRAHGDLGTDSFEAVLHDSVLLCGNLLVRSWDGTLLEYPMKCRIGRLWSLVRYGSRVIGGSKGWLELFVIQSIRRLM